MARRERNSLYRDRAILSRRNGNGSVKEAFYMGGNLSEKLLNVKNKKDAEKINLIHNALGEKESIRWQSTTE